MKRTVLARNQVLILAVYLSLLKSLSVPRKCCKLARGESSLVSMGWTCDIARNAQGTIIGKRRCLNAFVRPSQTAFLLITQIDGDPQIAMMPFRTDQALL